MTFSRSVVPPVIIGFFVIDVAIGLAYLLNHFAGEPSWMITELLDLDGEGNLPSWYSTIKLFLVSLLLGVFAVRNFDRSRARSWVLFLLPLVFLALSLDETAQIHEWLGRKSDVFFASGSREGSFFHVTGIWVFVVGGPFMAGFFVLLYSGREYFVYVPQVLKKIIIGFLIFLFGAIGLEVLSNMVDSHSVFDLLQVFSEELFEMIGVTVILWAAYDLLMTYGFSLRLGPVAHDPGYPRRE